MSRNTQLVLVALASLVVVGVVEVVSDYDYLARRLALLSTNLITFVFLLSAAGYLKRRFGERLPWVVYWVAASGVWLDALGNFQNYYTRYWWWDNVTHAGGTLAAAVSIYVFIRLILRRRGLVLGPGLEGMVIVAIGTTFSAFYEISEWWGDLLFDTRRVGDRFDTVSDLWYNFLGALVVVLVGAWIERRRRRAALLR